MSNEFGIVRDAKYWGLVHEAVFHTRMIKKIKRWKKSVSLNQETPDEKVDDYDYNSKSDESYCEANMIKNNNENGGLVDNGVFNLRFVRNNNHKLQHVSKYMFYKTGCFEKTLLFARDGMTLMNDLLLHSWGQKDKLSFFYRSNKLDEICCLDKT